MENNLDFQFDFDDDCNAYSIYSHTLSFYYGEQTEENQHVITLEHNVGGDEEIETAFNSFILRWPPDQGVPTTIAFCEYLRDKGFTANPAEEVRVYIVQFWESEELEVRQSSPDKAAIIGAATKILAGEKYGVKNVLTADREDIDIKAGYFQGPFSAYGLLNAVQ